MEMAGGRQKEACRALRVIEQARALCEEPSKLPRD
jgi:hypothetical protein